MYFWGKKKPTNKNHPPKQTNKTQTKNHKTQPTKQATITFEKRKGKKINSTVNKRF